VVPGSRREARRTDQRAVPESGRPRSVTVVAVLQIIGAALGLLGIPFTIANLAGATNMSEAQRLLFSDPIWRSWTTAGIPLGAAVSVVWIFVAIGLLRLRPAARTAAFWLLTYSIVMSVVLFFVVIKVFWTGPFPPGVHEASQAAKGERFLLFCGSLGGLVGGAIYSIILLVVLSKKKVAEAFRRGVRGCTS